MIYNMASDTVLPITCPSDKEHFTINCEVWKFSRQGEAKSCWCCFKARGTGDQVATCADTGARTLISKGPGNKSSARTLNV